MGFCWFLAPLLFFRAAGSDMDWSRFHQLATESYRRGDYKAAALGFSHALQELEQNAPDLRLLTTLGNLASACTQTGEFAKAARLFGRIQSLQQSLPQSAEMSRILLEIGINQAALAFMQGNIPQARDSFEALLPAAKKTFGQESLPVASIKSYLALVYNTASDYVQAREYAEEALTIRRSILDAQSPQIATSLSVLAQVLERLNDLKGAEYIALEALKIREHSPGRAKQLAEAKIDLGTILKRKGQYKEAEHFYLEARVILDNEKGRTGFELGLIANNLGSLYQAQGKRGKADNEFRQALEQMEIAVGPKHPAISLVLGNLSALNRATRKWDQAEALSRRAYAIDEQQFGKESTRAASDLVQLAEIALGRHEFDTSESLLLRALKMLQRTSQTSETYIADATFMLALLYQERGQPEKAAPVFAQTLSIWDRQPLAELDKAASLESYSRVLKRNRQFAEAEALATKALGIRVRAARANLVVP